MFKNMEQQERLEAMFKELSGGKKPTNTDLLRAADEKTALTTDELKESFRKKVWSYFAWLIRSVTPINYEGEASQPDFSIYFKEIKRNESYEWLRNMELPAKILNQGQSIEEFRQSSEYKRLKGMVIVMQMSKEISKSEFKEKFFSELNRIGDAFYK